MNNEVELDFFLKKSSTASAIKKKSKLYHIINSIRQMWSKVSFNTQKNGLNLISPEIILLQQEVDKMLLTQRMTDIATLMRHGYRFTNTQEKKYIDYFISNYCEKDRALNLKTEMQATLLQLHNTGFIFPDKVMQIIFFSFSTGNQGGRYMSCVGKYQKQDKGNGLYNEFTVQRYKDDGTAAFFDMVLEYYYDKDNATKCFETFLFLCKNQAIQPVAMTYYAELFLQYYLRENPQRIEEVRNHLINWSAQKEQSSYTLDEIKQTLKIIGSINISHQPLMETDPYMQNLIKIAKKMAMNEEGILEEPAPLKREKVPELLEGKIAKIDELFLFLEKNKEHVLPEDWINIEKLSSLRVAQIIKKYIAMEDLPLQKDEQNPKYLCIQALDNIQSFLQEKTQQIHDAHVRDINVLVRYTNHFKR